MATTKYASTPAEASGYDRFDQVVKRTAAELGISALAAMQLVRKSHPDLLEQERYADPAPDPDGVQKAMADGRTRQAQIDTAIAKRATSGKVDRLSALRELRREQPELFAD